MPCNLVSCLQNLSCALLAGIIIPMTATVHLHPARTSRCASATPGSSPGRSHAWSGRPEPGDVVDVADAGGRLAGARLLQPAVADRRPPADLGARTRRWMLAFWRRRLAAAGCGA